MRNTSGTLVTLCSASTVFRVRRVTVRVFVCVVHCCVCVCMSCDAHLFLVDGEH